MNATSRPSGDQRGEKSRANEAASQRMGVAGPPYTPMNEWSPRLETNASLVPSGDQTGDPLLPREVSSGVAAELPSIGTE